MPSAGPGGSRARRPKAPTCHTPISPAPRAARAPGRSPLTVPHSHHARRCGGRAARRSRQDPRRIPAGSPPLPPPPRFKIAVPPWEGAPRRAAPPGPGPAPRRSAPEPGPASPATGTAHSPGELCPTPGKGSQTRSSSLG